MNLHIGKMTRKELAEWFGMTLASYDKHKANKLEELKIFADFEQVYGGVMITNIKIPEYAKKGSRAYNIIRSKLNETWHKSGYDTASRVGCQIWRESEELQSLISENTAKVYAARVRSELFGRVHIQEKGSLGTCKYAYVVRNGWDEAILLTEEQNQIVRDLIKEIYVNEQEPLVHEAYKEGKITKEEYDDFMRKWQEGAEARYWEFTSRLETFLGFYPTKVTRVRRDEISAF